MLECRGGHGDTQLFEQFRCSDLDTRAIDLSDQPLAEMRHELLGRRERNAACFRGAHHRLRERMLRALLRARGPREHVVLGRVSERDDVGHFEAAVRERAGLVERERLHPAERFDETPALEEHSVAGRVGDRRQDRRGRGDHERARRSDDEQRHRAIERSRELVPEHERRDHDHQSGRDHDRDRVVAPDPFRDLFGLRLLLLRFLHQAHDAREGRVFGHARRAHLERALLVQRARKDPVADLLGDRHRFSGEVALVYERSTREDDTVHRDRLAWLYDHAFADLDRFGFDFDLAPIAYHQRPRGAQLEQRMERAARAAHGVDLERVAEREQEHQCRRFEDVADPARARRGQNHEQVHIEAELRERRHRRAQREPASGER